ncbi:MAG: hypothetical protein AAGU15_07180 [Anaerolineaceae bacterium]
MAQSHDRCQIRGVEYAHLQFLAARRLPQQRNSDEGRRTQATAGSGAAHLVQCQHAPNPFQG